MSTKSETALLTLLREAGDTLCDCIDDLTSWAAANPEGFTADEKKRLRSYERTFAKIDKRLRKQEADAWAGK